MTWLLLGLLVLAVVAYVSANRHRTAQRELAAADLAAVRRTVDEDVTVLGEELQRLDADLPPGATDQSLLADHQRALDAYEDAKQSAEAMRRPEDAKHVTEILDDGRYAIACVQARVDSTPLPTRRPPCFFDPRHGPSVVDVRWAPPGGALRDVPACALDTERVHAGAEPHSRQVLVGSARVPYWQAGSAFAPMAMGYFGGYGIASSLFLGTAMGSMFGAGLGGGYGETEGADGGDGDGGGDLGGDTGDVSGFDFGGDMGI